MAVATKRVVKEIPYFNLSMMDAKVEKQKLLPVAAYARVSTEKEEQEDSFERQVEHYTQIIRGNSAWRMVEIYADPGISGTRAEKRPNFMRMIDDCRAGKIKKILVKSISRFARNTVDALNYIRELKDLGVSIYFESENIDTMTPGGEVLITILAAMAEQESRTISTNIKWAWQRKFQSGEIILNTGLMLGYRREPELDEDGHKVYSIDDAEAEIVRRIYREFLSGKTLTRICRDLEADGIKTKLGKDKWRWKSVRSILTNEKYTGNAILGKTYKPDVLSKQRKKNDAGQAPQYYVENTHPAIISMEMFKLAQRELQRRDETKANVTNNSRFTSKYPFSGLLVCGECGARLRRHVRTMGTGEKVASWGCTTRITQGREACQSSHHVREDVLEKTYTAAIRKITGNSDEIYRTVEESTKLVLEPDNKEKLEAIEQQIIEVQEKALALHKRKAAGKLTEAEYDIKISEIKETMEALEAEQKQLQDTAIKYTEVKMWLENIKESISSETIGNADDAMLMKSLVDNIIIKTTGIEIHCKCGVTIEQEYVR